MNDEVEKNMMNPVDEIAWSRKLLATLLREGTAIVPARTVSEPELRRAVINGRSFVDSGGVSYVVLKGGDLSVETFEGARVHPNTTRSLAVKITYFKASSGKYYLEDERVEWKADPNHYTGWRDFSEVVRLHDMIAVCMNTPLGFPQMSLARLSGETAAQINSRYGKRDEALIYPWQREGVKPLLRGLRGAEDSMRDLEVFNVFGVRKGEDGKTSLRWLTTCASREEVSAYADGHHAATGGRPLKPRIIWDGDLDARYPEEHHYVVVLATVKVPS